jgi:hypothetical protein
MVGGTVILDSKATPQNGQAPGAGSRTSGPWEDGSALVGGRRRVRCVMRLPGVAAAMGRCGAVVGGSGSRRVGGRRCEILSVALLERAREGRHAGAELRTALANGRPERNKQA